MTELETMRSRLELMQFSYNTLLQSALKVQQLADAYRDALDLAELPMYRNTESGKVVSAVTLAREYEANKDQIRQDSGAESFMQWMQNALEPDGFLQEV